MIDADGGRSEVFRSGAPMTVRIGYETSRPVQSPGFAVDIHRDGVYCAGLSTRIDARELGLVAGAGHVDLEVDALQLASGCYTMSVGIHRANGIGQAGGLGLHDLHELAYPFSVISDHDDLGLIRLAHSWRHSPAARADLRVKSQRSGVTLVMPSKEAAIR
jgi:hypothetical protein